jgi:hypothetical protein
LTRFRFTEVRHVVYGAEFEATDIFEAMNLFPHPDKHKSEYLVSDHVESITIEEVEDTPSTSIKSARD